MKKTKIVATIGPASRSLEMVEKLADAGLDVARLNFSHDVHAQHEISIDNIRKVSREKGRPLAIIQDLQGARVRVGCLPKEGVKISKGELIVLTDEKNLDKVKVRGKKIIPITYPGLTKTVKVGHELYIQDKLVELITRKATTNYLICESKRDGVILEHKGINFPHSAVDLPTITEKDKRDIKFGIKKKVDYIALSFVRSADDVKELRQLIKKYAGAGEANNFKIIVKIERPEAIEHFDEILAETDAIMIARGDLGIELPPEDIPFIQKDLITRCLKAAKPVITATHMLDSMINNLHPTRAEVSDVANAIIDHTDAVMLSGETATGKYPAEAVEMMNKIAQKSEASALSELDIRGKSEKACCAKSVICTAISGLTRKENVKAILAVSLSEQIARMISRYRPNVPIFIAVDNVETERHLALSWGVFPFRVKHCENIEKLIDNSIKIIRKRKFIKKGEKIIVIADRFFANSEDINLVKVYKA